MSCSTPDGVRSTSQAGGLRHVFVYGTLRRRYRNKFARLLHSSALFLGNAHIRGRLYQFRRYRGAILSERPSEQVYGEVFRLEDLRVLETLDNYEGSEYKRAIVPVHLEDGQQIQAWVYIFRGKEKGKPLNPATNA